jgi:hypothetical protein
LSLSSPIPGKRLVVKKRSKHYPFRTSANTFVRTPAGGKRKVYHTDDPGGAGQEVVQELIVCPGCAG